MGPSTPICYFQHYFSGDTIINGLQYHVLHKIGDCRSSDNYFYVEDDPWILLREDSLEKKVYELSLDDSINQGPEILRWDFSKSIGDTVTYECRHCFNQPQESFIISGIEWLIAYNGDSLRSFKGHRLGASSRGASDTTLYTEGIVNGYFYFDAPHYFQGDERYCNFGQNAQFIFWGTRSGYQSGAGSPCDSSGYIDLEELVPVEFEFENPCWRYLNLNSTISGEVTIYQMNGVIKRQDKVEVGENELFLNNLEPGLYILNFRYNNGSQSHRLIITPR